MYSKVVLNGIEDLGGSAAAELTRGGSTELNEVRRDRFTIVHGVKCRNLGHHTHKPRNPTRSHPR